MLLLISGSRNRAQPHISLWIKSILYLHKQNYSVTRVREINSTQNGTLPINKNIISIASSVEFQIDKTSSVLSSCTGGLEIQEAMLFFQYYKQMLYEMTVLCDYLSCIISRTKPMYKKSCFFLIPSLPITFPYFWPR